MENKMSEFIDEQKKKHEHKQIEREYYRIFTNFYSEIQHELSILDESPQLLNALMVANSFRQICEKIGHDQTYKSYLNFLNLVRQKDREMDNYIDYIKRKYDFSDPEKHRVPTRDSSYSSQFLNRFLDQIKSYQEDLKSKKEDQKLLQMQKAQDAHERAEQRHQSKIGEKVGDNRSKTLKILSFDDEDNPLFKVRESIDSKLHPERVPVNRVYIDTFRKNMTEDQKKLVLLPLDIKDEIEIFRQYAQQIRDQLESWEKVGFYKHITGFWPIWSPFLEQIAKKCDSTRQYALKSEIRKVYLNTEEWLNRVNLKYENSAHRNPKEPTIDPNKLKDFNSQYEKMRESLIKELEDKRIWKLVEKEQREQHHEENIAERERIHKERAQKQEVELTERKSLRQEREKQHEADRAIHNQQKAEDAIKKEKLRQEREKQQIADLIAREQQKAIKMAEKVKEVKEIDSQKDDKEQN